MSLALGPTVRVATFILVLLTTAACSPAQQTAVGAGIAGAGLLVSSAAIKSMAEPCHNYAWPEHTCVDPEKTHPGEGVAVVLAGLGVTVVGGAIVASAHDSNSSRAAPLSDTPPPSPVPAPFDKDDAVGMAMVRLVFVGMDGNDKPGKLLDVDDGKSKLVVAGFRAKLSNLRIHLASDGTWLTLGACYAYDDGWHVTSLGTSPACE